MVDSANLVKRFATSVSKNAQTINNIASTREIVRWAYKANIGEVSDLYDCGDQFVIAVLVKKQDKGYVSLQEVAPVLSREILNDKKAAVVNEAIQGKSLAAIAELYKTQVDTVSNVTFASNVVAGAGVEPSLVAVAVTSEPGKVSQAVKGMNGVYAVEVTNVETNEPNIEAVKAVYQQQFTSLQNQAYQNIIDVEITDNRIKFY
jgi:peptidyl-prolyl cis-trans isomerase D